MVIYSVHIVIWQKALVHIIMFEQELFMFEHMPQLELCNKAIFYKLDYLVGERDVKTWKILKDVFL